jgi:hypothetical protein
MSAGIAAMHDRLLHEMRAAPTTGRLTAHASAMSLLMFGHSPVTEGAVRDAALRCARALTIDTTDEQLTEMFLAELPVAMDGIAVRAMFFFHTQSASVPEAGPVELLRQEISQYFSCPHCRQPR